MEEKTEKLTQEQLDETLLYFDEFEKGLYNQQYKFGSFPMYSITNKYYTPELINKTMQQINNNPFVPRSEEDLNQALANPNNSERILRNYATFYEINNIFYKRLVNFNANLPAWNLTFDCINIESEEEFESEAFNKDLKVIDNFCSKFNLKNDFRIIFNQILRQGVYYGVFRDEGEFYSWQQLPSDFCQITGDSNVGKLFDFNFSYFINNVGSNIDMFPKKFKTLLRETWLQIGKKPYNPKGNIDTRHSSFAYWKNLSPSDNFFCFNLNDGLTTLIPYYSGLFPDLYIQPMLRKLEVNKSMIAAQKLLVNLIETYENAKTGTVPNQYKVTPNDVGQFMALIKKALGETIKAVALPAKDSKIVDFSVEAENRYGKSQQILAEESVSSSASLLSREKLNAFESQLSLTIDENFVKGIYGQFEKFLNYYLNKRTSKYKFKFMLDDTNTEVSRDKRKELFTDYAAMGLVDLNLYARSIDRNIFEAKRSLAFTKSQKVEKYLTKLASLNNQTKESGRPTENNTDNDNTMASQERQTEDL